MLVERHAVGAAFTKQFPVLKCAILLNGVAIDFAVADVGDVEHGSIGRADQTVGSLEAIRHSHHVTAARLDVVDVHPVLRQFLVAVVRVGEIYAALGIDPQVVWLVEFLAVVALGQGAGVAAVRRVGHHALGIALTGVEASVIGKV